MTLAETKAQKISAMPFTISANVEGSGSGGFVGWFTRDILLRAVVFILISTRRRDGFVGGFTINILIPQRRAVVGNVFERRYGIAARCRLLPL